MIRSKLNLSSEEILNRNVPLYARRKFLFSGRTFNVGDEFPWTRMAVNARTIIQLHSAGKLTTSPPVLAPKKAPKKEVAPVVEPQTPENQEQDDKIEVGSDLTKHDQQRQNVILRRKNKLSRQLRSKME